MFRKEPLTPYQQRVNDAAGDICVQNPSILTMRGELLGVLMVVALQPIFVTTGSCHIGSYHIGHPFLPPDTATHVHLYSADGIMCGGNVQPPSPPPGLPVTIPPTAPPPLPPLDHTISRSLVIQTAA